MFLLHFYILTKKVYTLDLKLTYVFLTLLLINFLLRMLQKFLIFHLFCPWNVKKLPFEVEYFRKIEEINCPKLQIHFGNLVIQPSLYVCILGSRPFYCFYCVQSHSGRWPPQFYIQLVYKPHFGTWILLFGPVGQLRQ